MATGSHHLGIVVRSSSGSLLFVGVRIGTTSHFRFLDNNIGGTIKGTASAGSIRPSNACPPAIHASTAIATAGASAPRAGGKVTNSDSGNGIAGAFLTQIFPFADPTSVAGFLEMEKATYQHAKPRAR